MKRYKVYKTDYPELYKFHCKGYLGQILACNYRKPLERAIKNWPGGDYEIKEIL